MTNLYQTDPDWLESPIPLIGLLGRTDIHPAIIQNVPKTKPLHFITLQPGATFSQKKNRRASYEGYDPIGILRTSWIKKHTRMIPAVCLMLLEWDINKNLEKQEGMVLHCVDKFKRDCRSRDSIKLILVFGLHKAPTDEELKILIRCAKRAGVEHSSKAVLTLPTNDFKNSLRKLEAAAYDMACDYYKYLGKRVKSLKHKVSKSTQPKLCVRHHFKIGFFAEIIKDFPVANKFYTLAYNFLKQIVCNEDGAYAMEIKVIAEILNSKIIRLLLQLRRTPEAMNQFRSHIRKFKTMIGLKKISFAHHQWMATQYHYFAEVTNSLGQITHNGQRNSGYFYQTAAAYSVLRKNAANAALKNSGPLANPNEFIKPMYIGQSCIKKDASSTNSSAEAMISSRLSEEAAINHSQVIIRFLTKAYESFKKQKSNRMILHIAAQMADEYYTSNNYQMAKKFFDKIAQQYRQERWAVILTDILVRAIECARRINAGEDLVRYAIELIGKNSCATREEKESLQEEVIKVINDNSLNTSIKLSRDFELLNVFSLFHKSTELVQVKEKLAISLRIRANFPSRIEFSAITIRFCSTTTPVEHNYTKYDITLVPKLDGQRRDKLINKTISTCENESTEYEEILIFDDTISEKKSIHKDGSPRQIFATTSFEPRTTRIYRIVFNACCPTLHEQPMKCSSVYFHLSSSSHSFILNCQAMPMPLVSKIRFDPPPSFQEDNKEAKLKNAQLDHTQIEEGLDKKEDEETVKARTIFDTMKILCHELVITPAKPKAYFEVDQCGPALVNDYHRLGLTICTDTDYFHNATISFDYNLQSTEKSKTIQEREESNSLSKKLEEYPMSQFFIHPDQKKQQNCVKTNRNGSDHDGVKIDESDEGVDHDKGITDNSCDGNDGQFVPLESTLPIPSLQPQSTHRMHVFLRCCAPITHQVTVTIRYNNEEGVNLIYVARFQVLVQMPFIIYYRFFSRCTNSTPTYKKVSSKQALAESSPSSDFPILLAGEPCVVHCEIENRTVHKLNVKNIHLQPNQEYVQVIGQQDMPGVMHLASGERYSTSFEILPIKEAESSHNLRRSKLKIQWCRSDLSILDEEEYYGSEEDDEWANGDEAKETRTSDIVRHDISNLKSNWGIRPQVRRTRPKTLMRAQFGEEDSALSVLSPRRTNRRFNFSNNPQKEKRKKRSEGPSPVFSVSFISQFPMFHVEKPPLDVVINHPPRCFIGTTFLLTVTLVNTSALPHDIEFNVIEQKAIKRKFSYALSGRKSGHFILLPKSKETLYYRVAALDCGLLPLPRINLKSSRCKKLLINPETFGSIFVLPTPKGNIKSSRESQISSPIPEQKAPLPPLDIKKDPPPTLFSELVNLV